MVKNDTIYLASCRSLKIKSEGFNCAQACLGGLAPQIGLDQGCAMKLTAAFGGGMRHKQLCGAVVGAGIALGLAFGSTEADAKTDEKVGELTVAFINRFKEAFGTTTCEQLLTDELEAFDWDIPPEMKLSNNNQYGNVFNIKAPICGMAITSAVRFVLDIIKNEKE